MAQDSHAHSHPTTSVAGGAWDPSKPLVPALFDDERTGDGGEGAAAAYPCLVLVGVLTDSEVESRTLAEAFQRCLPNIHPLSPQVGPEGVAVILCREATNPLDAAFSVLDELARWSFDVDAVYSGYAGGPTVVRLERM